jgi:predicted GTPase
LSEFEVNHLNVLLVGPSGVGKSCLINSILELDDDKKAETEITKPTTKTFNMYESEKKPNIRLIDSRGIEKGDYNIDSLLNEITKYYNPKEVSLEILTFKSKTNIPHRIL